MPAISLAVIAGIILFASHFLFSRWKSVVVPTVLFWHEVQSQNRRDILWGKFSSLLTLLLLLVIAFLMVLAMMKPGFGQQQISTIVLDVSPATDINKAKTVAEKIVDSSDKCYLIVSGKDYSVKANEKDSVLTTLANINELQTEENNFSSINQAVNEAENISEGSNVYVITGQNIDVNDGTEIICVPKQYEPSETIFNVWVPKELSGITDRYFAVDTRYQQCSLIDNADIVLNDDDVKSLPDWRSISFVQSFRSILDDKAGIANRNAIYKSEILSINDFSPPDRSSFLSFLYFGIFILLAMNLYMYKMGRIQ